MVALVVCWYSHESTSTIVPQDIVGHPDGHFGTIDRVDGVTTGEDACFLFIFLAFNF